MAKGKNNKKPNGFWAFIAHTELGRALTVGFFLAVLAALGWVCVEVYNVWSESRKDAREAASDEKEFAEQKASALETIVGEIVARRITAKSHLDAGLPNKAWSILDGQDSRFVNSPSLAGTRLSKLISDLQLLHYNWHGVDEARLKELADGATPADLDEISRLLEQAFPQ